MSLTLLSKHLIVSVYAQEPSIKVGVDLNCSRAEFSEEVPIVSYKQIAALKAG
jgi:hypothetical protein